MTLRFRALAVKAGVVSAEYNGFDANELSASQRKFAELIVKECMDIVSKQTTLDTNEDFREGFNHGLKYAWTDIRKHFGIK